MAGVGVWRGEFPEAVLRNCPLIERYYMIDPWRHLPRWNKPANVSEPDFEKVFAEAMSRTSFAENRRIVLRGTTTEVINSVPDGALDFAYIDGDHMLRGISVDLLAWYEKVKENGHIGGDDFTPSIWQHSPRYEPSMVFPFAVHFAEARERPITACPHNQFLIDKGGASFAFTDPFGRYSRQSVQDQIANRPSMLTSALGKVRRRLRRAHAVLTGSVVAHR